MPRRKRAKQIGNGGHSAGINHHSFRSILDLPTELIIMVLDLIEDDDSLYSLSLSSKTLHQLALPVFIAHQDGEFSDGNLTMIGPSEKMLRAMRIALHVEHLESISITFNRFPLSMKSLGRLIQRMSHVRTVRLTYDLPYTGIFPFGVGEGIENIMMALVDKSCEALTLSGQGQGWLIGEVFFYARSPQDVTPLNTLKTMHIHSVLLCPRLQNRIIKSLNSSPVQSLNLHHLQFTYGPLSSVGEILHLLTLPALSFLAIASEKLQFSDLAAFLCRHPGVTAFILQCKAPIPPDCPAIPASALPNLLELQAPPHHIRYLLRTRGLCPELNRLVIRADHDGLWEDDRYPFRYVEDSLATLTRRHKVNYLGLYVPSASQAEEWLTTGCHARRGKRRDVERSLTHIETVSLHTGDHRPLAPRLESLVVNWLGLFPALRIVALNSCFNDRTAARMMEAIGEACPRLESARFDPPDV
jgi:hypothetical protein